MWLVREKERAEELKKQHTSENETNKNNVYEYKISLWNRLYYNKIFRGLIILLAVSILGPVFYILFSNIVENKYISTHSCSVKYEYQISCGAQNTTYEECANRRCCFNQTDTSCVHYVPSFYYYTNENNSTKYIPSEMFNPYTKLNKLIYLNVIYTPNQILVTLSREKKQETNELNYINSMYNATIFENLMAVEVSRANCSDRIMSTAFGPAIISKRYWEWSVNLFAEHLFGMDFFYYNNEETISRVLYKNAEEHAIMPKFLAYANGAYHGLEIDHDGPLEITVLPSKLIVLRMMSGNFLTLKLSVGPTPVDVYRQQMLNYNLYSVPFWALGVHICRDGEIKDYLTETENLLDQDEIIYESDCLHENLFSLSWKNDQDLTNIFKKMKDKNKKFMLSLAPHILVENSTDSPYKKAEDLNILIYDFITNTTPYWGSYLNNLVGFVDYSLNKSYEWFKEIYNQKFSSLQPQGIILKDNWPVNNNNVSDIDESFYYLPQELRKAALETIPWNCTNSEETEHIIKHNHYGSEFANVVVTETQTNFVLSSSYTLRSKVSAYMQNIDISWTNFKLMLTRTLSHSLFGSPLFSVPVCGSTSNFSKKDNQNLCIRWYLTAATMPLFRISSDVPRRDPTLYNDMIYVKEIMLEAINTRYKLLPYFYSTLSDNLPIIRPMFFQFPHDNETFKLDEQYMVGESLLIVQPSHFPTTAINVYLPKINGNWYNFWSGIKIPNYEWMSVPIIESDIVAYISAGSIIPLQSEAISAEEFSKNTTLSLVIALYCNNPSVCVAKGKFQKENSLLVTFKATETNITIFNANICNNSSINDQFQIANIILFNDNVTHVTFDDSNSKFCIRENENSTLDFIF